MKTPRLVVLAAVALAALAGCATFPFLQTTGPSRDAPLYRNGQIVDIVGRVIVDKNRILLQDQDSPALFVFVGLEPAAQKALAGLEGKYTKVRLRVVSVQSARGYNAQFIQFATRD
jgi:hypothetical protein